jgi:hypothetical protein
MKTKMEMSNNDNNKYQIAGDCTEEEVWINKLRIQSDEGENRAQSKLDNTCVNRLVSLTALLQLEGQKFD